MILQVIECRSTGEFSQGHHHKHLQEIKKMMAETGTFLSELQGRIIFLRMFNDMEWWTNQNEPKCLHSAVEVALEFAQGRGSCLGPGNEEAWCGTSDNKPKRTCGTPSHKNVRIIPHEGTSCIVMFLPTLELLMRTTLAVNQLTICHAVSIWYNRVHQCEMDFGLNFSVDDVTT